MVNSPLNKIEHSIFDKYNLNVYVKRDDLIHPLISGNKWRKGHYLLKHIKENGFSTVITFGGAYSNHIHSFSYACNQLGIKSIGIIRGEELKHKELNKTLSFSKDQGMELIFVSREEYKKRYDSEYCNNLSLKYNAYIVPEGGTTKFAINGFKDMVEEVRNFLDNALYFVPCGSGGTIGGINANLKNEEFVYGVNVVKGNEKDLDLVIKSMSNINKFCIVSDYHFNGYAKTNKELEDFICFFEKEFGIEIESVYSGKMFFAFFDMIKKNKINNRNVVLCHTGGLQGKR